ncbi:MAG: putative peptidoglycan glycosyltransferase FtsW [Candidatus Sumerlaeota bacterium]|nr:putative peptidoglycan glycosyltransferase FtsW [Candidatus Sumerlaeota bacterium]
MMPSKRKNPFALNYAIPLFLVALSLMCFGLVMVYASSSTIVRKPKSKSKMEIAALTTLSDNYMRVHSTSFLQKQALWALVGLITIFVFAHLSYANLQRAALYALAIAIIGLAAVYFFPPVNGSRRWMRLGPLSLQPSELAKLAMVVAMAAYLTRCSDYLPSIKRCLLGAVLMVGAVAGLIYKEPDFGSAAVIGLVVFSMWWVAGLRKWQLVGMVVLGGPLLTWLMLREPYRRLRILAYLDPEKYAHTGGWHPLQSLIALGSGGVYGVGLGQSMQKFQFLTESHTDFIFSIIGEELGLVGVSVVLVVYLLLIILALRVTWQTPDTFGHLLAFGLTAMIAIPTLVNLGVVTSSLPTKGLALPFISYGGSSLLVNCAAIGILMNIAAANYAERRMT